MRSYYKNMHVSLISYQVIRFITVFFTECWQSFWQMWACLFPVVFYLFMLFRTMTTRYLQCVVLYINLNVWFLIAYSISGCGSLCKTEKLLWEHPPIWGAKSGLTDYHVFPPTQEFFPFLVLIISLFLGKSKLFLLRYAFFFLIPYITLHCAPFFMKEHFILKINYHLELLVWNFMELIQE